MAPFLYFFDDRCDGIFLPVISPLFQALPLSLGLLEPLVACDFPLGLIRFPEAFDFFFLVFDLKRVSLVGFEG